ncbi:hypothetical protein WJX84_003917 [Apatococcus fuscideae]|uniref:Uncharacterized protein n=1 Tax=Apatococcus fuscideae TaxID=2026836 RepID=A0AAW1SVK7_9CHLO
MEDAQAQLPADLAHVQNVLAQEGTTSSGQFSWRSTEKKRQNLQQGHHRQPQGETCGPGFSRSEHGSSSSSSSKRFRPAAKGSTGGQQGQRSCAICECKVGAGPRSWQIHTEGIQHRRRALSLELTGSPDHLVTSAFENLQRNPADKKRGSFGGNSSRVDSALVSELLDCSVAHIRTQALKMLLEITGASVAYSQGAQNFTEGALAQAALSLQPTQAEQAKLDDPSAGPSGEPPEHCFSPTYWAALAHSSESIFSTHLQLLAGQFSTSLPGSSSIFPAAAVAVCMMAQRLQGAAGVRRWSLDFRNCRSTRPDTIPCWRVMLRSLKTLLQNPGNIRSLHCRMPAGNPSSLDHWQKELVGAQREAQEARCTLLLCGSLSAKAQSCPLQHLPQGPLKIILNASCASCVVLVDWPSEADQHLQPAI